jgi:translation initiation factor IF-1
MPPRDHLQAQGTVREILRDGGCRVELANGHRCIARPGPRQAAAFLSGDTVLLAFHPYDLSRARIVLTATPK